MATAGEHFAQALAAKDSAALRGLLADPVDFMALTPGRHWQATSGQQAVEEIILGHWFGPGDDVLGLVSVATGRVAEREHVCYRMRVRRSGSDYLVEQQAYYDTDSERITWMRILCAGYQPARPKIFSSSSVLNLKDVRRPWGQVVLSPSAIQSSTSCLISGSSISRPARTAP